VVKVIKMNAKKILTALSLIFTLVFAGIVYGAASTNPQAPSNIDVDGNTTNAYPLGMDVSGTRGYIYNLTINHSQTTNKWTGYVGNINGEFALQDSAGKALYDWDITTIKGELYATKEGAYQAGYNESNSMFAGGIPTWADLKCANRSMLNWETKYLNHSSVEEDRLNNTFKNGADFDLTTFYAGGKLITDSTSWDTIDGDCYGIYLNNENGDQSTDWEQVVLSDGTYQFQDESQADDKKAFDLLYASILENDVTGYDNSTYDFQIMLPQFGEQGDDISNIVYYFYVELI
jgi:hypothetical protein